MIIYENGKEAKADSKKRGILAWCEREELYTISAYAQNGVSESSLIPAALQVRLGNLSGFLACRPIFALESGTAMTLVSAPCLLIWLAWGGRRGVGSRLDRSTDRRILTFERSSVS
jgi:hypothetical protein